VSSAPAASGMDDMFAAPAAAPVMADPVPHEDNRCATPLPPYSSLAACFAMP